MATHVRPRCFLDMQAGTEPLGRIVIELFDDKTPKTCENFRVLCTGTKGPQLHYKSSIFHRVIEEFMIQGGDITRGDGKGGLSIYGETFEDEALHWRNLDTPYLVAMANRGPATNSSQFFITLEDCSHLNGKHTVFGHVVSGMPVVKKIESTRTNSDDKPLTDIIIANCGELEFKRAPVSKSTKGISERESKRSTRHRSRSTSSDRGNRGNGSSREHGTLSKHTKRLRDASRSRSRSQTPSSRTRDRSSTKEKDQEESNQLTRGRSPTPQPLSSHGGSRKSRHRSQSPSRSHTPPIERRSRSPKRRSRSRSRERHRRRHRHHQKERQYNDEEEEMIRRQEDEREGGRFYENDTHMLGSGSGAAGEGGIVFKGRGVMKFREKKRWGGGNRHGRLD